MTEREGPPQRRDGYQEWCRPPINTSKIHWLFIVIAMVTLLAGCSKTPSPSTTQKPSEVSFDWTCEARGRLEPCGCFTGQHGGLSRVSTYLHSAEVLAGEHLLADVGNAIAGTADYQVIQYRYMQQAFSDRWVTSPSTSVNARHSFPWRS